MKKLASAFALFTLLAGFATAAASEKPAQPYAEVFAVTYHCKTGAVITARTGKATPLFVAAFNESITPDAFIGLIATTLPEALPMAQEFISACLGEKTAGA